MDDKNQAIDHVEKFHHADQSDGAERRASVVKDNIKEHELTFRDVARNHKMLIWWSFYFAMCAVGW